MGNGMLIVCGKREFGEQLCRIVSSAFPGCHSVAGSGAEARRKTGQAEYECILIAGGLRDENGTDLAYDLTAAGCRSVAMLTDRQSVCEAHEALDGTGVTILVMPLTKDALIHSLRLLTKFRESGGTLEKAKIMLMQLKNFTEPQAHRYIQKLSMDKRLPREVAAQLVIRALEKGAK